MSSSDNEDVQRLSPNKEHDQGLNEEHNDEHNEEHNDHERGDGGSDGPPSPNRPRRWGPPSVKKSPGKATIPLPIKGSKFQAVQTAIDFVHEGHTGLRETLEKIATRKKIKVSDMRSALCTEGQVRPLQPKHIADLITFIHRIGLRNFPDPIVWDSKHDDTRVDVPEDITPSMEDIDAAQVVAEALDKSSKTDADVVATAHGFVVRLRSHRRPLVCGANAKVPHHRR
jgi:hypothetical protein